MVAKDDTSKPRRSRTAAEPASLPEDSGPTVSALTIPSRSRGILEQAIEAERAQLLQAHGVLVCLYEVLLHADGEDAVSYAQAAHVAADLIERSVERLDLVRLRPLADAVRDRSEVSADDLGGGYCLREPRPVYVA